LLVCTGTGSSIAADCIAGSGGYAGIVYWVTGLCHQTAKRILWPVNTILPDSIPDIAASYTLFDEYGYDLLGAETSVQRRDRYSPPAPPSSSSKEAILKQPSSSDVQFTIGSVSSMTYGIGNSASPDRREKLSALVRKGLGHSIDDRTVEGLVRMQADLQNRQRELAQLVMTKEISREKYIDELDEALKNASRAGEALLGYSDFHKVFGEFRVHNLGDPKVFTDGTLSAR
jgi:hypothetical protein